MRPASFVPSVTAVLALCSPASASAQAAAGEPRLGWYIGGGGGANWASNIDQSGWNRDPLCYPTDACFDEDPRPEVSGYRWRYDLETATGAAFELSAGFIFRWTRLELSFAQQRNDLDQMFLSVTNLDGMAMESRHNSTVVADTQSSIDHLSVRTLSVNGYYDFPVSSLFSPYLGAGIGPAFVTVAGMRFTDRYMDTAVNGDVYDPPLSSYNASLDADLSDTTMAGHLHAGADFGLTDEVLLGLKLTYSMLADIETSGAYDLHAAHALNPNFMHNNIFSAARFWTLMFTVKYAFGN